MHLRALRLKEFRGFTDLSLVDIPASARLVLLIGPNGTGKSSIFDALLTWSGAKGSTGYVWEPDFHLKQATLPNFNWPQSIEHVEFHEAEPNNPAAWKKLCYCRSAYRNEADFAQGNLGSLPDLAERRFLRMIENDAAVAINYRRLIMQTIRDVWGTGKGRSVTLEEYANAVVKKVNDSLERVLPLFPNHKDLCALSG